MVAFQNSVEVVNRNNVYLVSNLRDGNRATNLRCPSSVDHTIIGDEIPHRAHSVVECTLSFVDDLYGDQDINKSKY